MKGRLQSYIPELTIRDYNTYLWYQRGVCRQIYAAYGLWACRLVRHNGVVAALISDGLAGREATCRRQRLPGTLCWKRMMCQTQGIRLAAQTEVLMGWHNLQDRAPRELRLRKRVQRALDRLLLRRAYQRAARENPSLERLLEQERAQTQALMSINSKNYAVAAEPMCNIYSALYALLATEDSGQRKSLRYIGSGIGRVFYLLDKAESFDADRRAGRYNVFVENGLANQQAAEENARRQALAVANDFVRVYSMMDIKMNRSLLDNIMLLGLRHAVDPLDQASDIVRWELP